MGRIRTPVRIESALNSQVYIDCNALVDTGAAYMVLPTAWRKQLSELSLIRKVTVQLGDQSEKTGDMCGPVRIQIEGFPPIYSEVLFVEMQPYEGSYEPLIGYIPLEQSQAAVDMVGHRLLPVTSVDLK